MNLNYSPKYAYRNTDGLDDINCHMPLGLDGKESASDRKLLVICHSYNNFQKDTIESQAKYFKETNVLVRTNPFAELTNIFHLPQLERFNIAYKIDLKRKPQNIKVIPTPLWYLPGIRSYKALGNGHFDHVKNLIKEKGIKFDIIHSHFTWSAGYVGARLKEENGIPLIITGHGYDVYSLPFKDNEWQDKIRWVMNTANHIITVSQNNLACIKQLHVSTPVTVIPNGFKGDLFYPRNSIECRKILNLPEDKKIILTVGSLVPVKGQKYLVEAIQRLFRERKDVLCLVIGTGKLHNILKRQIHSLGLDNNVILIGGRPHSEIPIWMNACDIFVLPSLKEGNPTVMFEAMGSGKPFVGTKVGGVPDIITSEEYGLLVKPADPKELAENILRALDQDWNREAILHYAEQFTWDNIAKEIMGVYDRVLG